MEKLNRIKGALADAGKTNIWLAEQIYRDPVTVSKWSSTPANLICKLWQKIQTCYT